MKLPDSMAAEDELDQLIDEYLPQRATNYNLGLLPDEEGYSTELTEMYYDSYRKREELKAAINAYTTNKIIQKEEQARQLNDGLRRAAEFMHKNGLLPPDTTTVDGIRSYFLNEARFAEALNHRKVEND